MIIKKCTGYELEKEKSNTSEDFFNRSELTFIDEGVEKTLHVLYLRYFDENFSQFVPFEKDPLFQADGKDIYFKDIVALVCMIKNPGLRSRKRLYVHTQKEFAAFFNGIDFAKIPEIFQSLETKGSYDMQSPLEFVLQHK
ncbi:hypothetical protein D1B31_09730 [Neobacillus notoginsengisoli]|uniref:Uncharacterized protein n=1 Tax=Neobacillus notoginsengisoli TaxID=1578198 RepID=A0A417YVG5_9BACI|nr:hypothetical protein [Neobacillus notoginsengisoli]RHW41202.1 hypothetical protein D1B31_09730 [Neobacillus notoginsengisoli]